MYPLFKFVDFSLKFYEDNNQNNNWNRMLFNIYYNYSWVYKQIHQIHLIYIDYIYLIKMLSVAKEDLEILKKRKLNLIFILGKHK